MVHFLKVGRFRGFDPSEMFDTAWYVQQKPTARLHSGGPIIHFLEIGLAAGLDPTAVTHKLRIRSVPVGKR